MIYLMKRDALDDGLSGDESSCSDASYDYEESKELEFMISSYGG
jgi:hypothetical protein